MLQSDPGASDCKATVDGYAKIETNRMNIKVSELVALRSIFCVDYNAFFSGLESDAAPCIQSGKQYSNSFKE